MSHIKMPCPHCGHQLLIPERYAGQRAGCAHCKGRFVVPDAPVGAVPESEEEFAPRSISSLERMDIDGSGDLVAGDLSGGLAGGASLSSLENFDLDGGGETSAFSEVERERVQQVEIAGESLGCLYWGLAFHLPPVALIWALFLPKGHSQKAIGLGVSSGFLLLAIALIAAFTLM